VGTLATSSADRSQGGGAEGGVGSVLISILCRMMMR
jgi:hypothetical protein